MFNNHKEHKGFTKYKLKCLSAFFSIFIKYALKGQIITAHGNAMGQFIFVLNGLKAQLKLPFQGDRKFVIHSAQCDASLAIGLR
ncbi:MAG: hypothetical protein EHM93_19830 [Bacteroidales bacterium]|nr:MAG: hypothetical protein EHM93_19830 [Bacteroidales bacterium]